MIYLFNKNEELFKIIPKKDVIAPITDEILNGLLQIDVEVLDKHFEYVKNAEFIGHKDYENENIFCLYKINSINTNNYNLKITGLHTAFDDLKSYGYIKDKRPTNTTADIALAQILVGSRWEVGNVQVSNTGSANFYDISRLDALSKLIDVWKCEIGYRMIFDGQKIIGRYIDLYNQRGTDTGKRFVYGTNALTIEYEENKNEIYTALVGRGKGEEKYDEEGNPTGGYGRKITFENIEWSKPNGDPVDKPLGQDYVEIPEMTSLYGYSDGSPRVKLVDYNDVEDPEELLQVTYNDLLNTSRPKIQFKSTVERIGNIHIGDTVRIIRQDLGFYYTARVFEIKRNLLNNAKTEVKLGDYINRSSAKKNKELRNELKNLSNALSEVAINMDIKKESLVQQMQDYLMTSLYNEDGYNYDLRAGNEYGLPAGYYSFDSPIELNPTKVIYVGAGKMAIANEKDSNGDWKWTTWGTGDGLVADAIVTGMLAGGKVQWNLDTGTLLIGNSVEDYQLLYDGNSLSIRMSSGKTIEEEIQATETSVKSYVDTQASNAESNAKTYTDNQLTDYVDFTVYNQEIADIKNQVDKNITTWFGNNVPDLTNYPAIDWTTNEDKNVHLGDLYYDDTTGYAYRFVFENSVYSWKRIQDSDITKALNDASKAQDTADGKRRVFVDTPIPPYDVGDLWTQGSNGDLYRCINTKASNQTYASSDWEKAVKYTDDTRAEQVKTEAITYIDDEVAEIKITTDSITQRVSDTETTITKKADTTYVDGQISTVNTNISNVSDRTSTLETNLDGITSRVSSTESNITTLDGKVTNQESRLSSAEQKITDDAIVSTVRSSTTYQGDLSTTESNAKSYADEKVDNIEVGGRNLLTNTDEETVYSSSSREYVRTPYDFAPIIDKLGLIEYTLSFDLKSDIAGYIVVYMQNGNGSKYGFLKSIQATTEWNRYFVTFTPTLSDETITESYLSFYGTYDSGKFPHIRKVQLEKGNKATDWTPAPEDVDDKIDTKANSEDLNTVSTNLSAQISQMESQIEQNKESITMGVTKEDLLTRNVWGINLVSNKVENWEQGFIDIDTGELIPNVTSPPLGWFKDPNGYITTKDYIDVKTGFEYYIDYIPLEERDIFQVFFYDTSYNYLGFETVDTSFVVPENAVCIKISIGSDLYFTEPLDIVDLKVKIEENVIGKTELFTTHISDIYTNYDLSNISMEETVSNPVLGDLWGDENQLKIYSGTDWVLVGWIQEQDVINRLNVTESELRLLDNNMKIELSQLKNDQYEISTYFNFGYDGLDIGKSDSPFSISLSNEQLDFKENGNSIAWINGQKMYITSTEITSDLTVGVHKIEKYNDDITLIKYVG